MNRSRTARRENRSAAGELFYAEETGRVGVEELVENGGAEAGGVVMHGVLERTAGEGAAEHHLVLQAVVDACFVIYLFEIIE